MDTLRSKLSFKKYEQNMQQVQNMQHFSDEQSYQDKTAGCRKNAKFCTCGCGVQGQSTSSRYIVRKDRGFVFVVLEKRERNKKKSNVEDPPQDSPQVNLDDSPQMDSAYPESEQFEVRSEISCTSSAVEGSHDSSVNAEDIADPDPVDEDSQLDSSYPESGEFDFRFQDSESQTDYPEKTNVEDLEVLGKPKKGGVAPKWTDTLRRQSSPSTRAAFELGTAPDLLLVVNKEHEFKIHQRIVKRGSLYFQQRLMNVKGDTSVTLHIHSPLVSPEALRTALGFLYGGSFDKVHSEMDLRRTAVFFGMDGVLPQLREEEINADDSNAENNTRSVATQTPDQSRKKKTHLSKFLSTLPKEE